MLYYIDQVFDTVVKQVNEGNVVAVIYMYFHNSLLLSCRFIALSLGWIFQIWYTLSELIVEAESFDAF